MNEKPLTDRERILTKVIECLASTASLCNPVSERWSSNPYLGKDGKIDHVHFAPWKKPETGDLVLAKTGGISEWKIGFYISPLNNDVGGAVIREIGSQRVCNYANELFEPILGLDPLYLLEGEGYRLYIKVLKAIRKEGGYSHRFGGFRFEEKDAVVTIREKFGGPESVPFEIRFAWSKRMSVKAIAVALKSGGLGTREFERRDVPSDSGQRILMQIL